MKRKNFLKTFYLICSITVLLLCPTTIISVQAAESPISDNTSEGETIQPRAAIIEWVFRKDDDGKVYRRLYNHQTKEWIGDWILCN